MTYEFASQSSIIEANAVHSVEKLPLSPGIEERFLASEDPWQYRLSCFLTTPYLVVRGDEVDGECHTKVTFLVVKANKQFTAQQVGSVME